jgi:hypothetical protein
VIRRKRPATGFALNGMSRFESRLKTPVTTVVGAAVAVTLATGKYDSNLLINLGQNRWTVRP